MSCFNCFKPKKKPRQSLFPQLTEEEMQEQVEKTPPVDDVVHGRNAYKTLPGPKNDGAGPSGVNKEGEITSDQNPQNIPGSSGVLTETDEITTDHDEQNQPQGTGDDITNRWLQPERRAAALNLGFIPGGRTTPQVLPPDVKNALEQYDKLALEQSAERENNLRIERENNAERENQLRIERENKQRIERETRQRIQREYELLTDREKQERLKRDDQEDLKREKLEKQNQASSEISNVSESGRPLGPSCSRCTAAVQLHRFSDSCEHLFCDNCLGNYMSTMIEHRIWTAYCLAEGCTAQKTARELNIASLYEARGVLDWFLRL